MSKLGRVALDLTEQAQELGFETVQEAIDNGYVAVYYKDGDVALVPRMDKELLEAHEKWEAKKKEIIDKLEMLINDTPYQVYKDTLRETINFIQEGEV